VKIAPYSALFYVMRKGERGEEKANNEEEKIIVGE